MVCFQLGEVRENEDILILLTSDVSGHTSSDENLTQNPPNKTRNETLINVFQFSRWRDRMNEKHLDRYHRLSMANGPSAINVKPKQKWCFSKTTGQNAILSEMERGKPSHKILLNKMFSFPFYELIMCQGKL